VDRLRSVARLAASVGVVGLLTIGYRLLGGHVDPTTVALSYVVVILVIATSWGITESTSASVAAMLCLNFFFLPPVGTLTIADPQNWVALVVFLLTAIIASQLSGRARRRAIEAVARQHDLERLYALSRALLLSEAASMPRAIARHIADAFDLRVVALYDQRADRVWWAGHGDLPDRDVRLRDVARRGVTLREPDGLEVIAIQLGGVSAGSLAMLDSGLSDTVVHSIVNLAAIGLERARSEEAAARADLARESSDLRAAVLDALAHDFKTPLTSMKAAAVELLDSPALLDRDRELATIVDEDLDRLQALVTDAVQMLRIDAGDFAVHPARHDLAAVVDAALRRFERRLEGHTLKREIPPGSTVDADSRLLDLALRQLLDNALKYSPPTSTIGVEARTNAVVEITVSNSGSAIPEREQEHVVERFYRGAHARQIPGTGLGLAIVQKIVEAHGGTLRLSSTDAGTAFTLTFPRGGVHP
jgi:two-component system sensor histidine kinase KdpD